MLGDHLMLSADLRVRALVRWVLWSILALVTALGGIGFLGAALWLWTSGHLGPVTASLILGFIFLAVALIGVLMASTSRSRVPIPPPKVGVDDLAQAFVAAAELGRAARRRK